MPLLANAQAYVTAAPGTGAALLGAATPGAQSWADAGAVHAQLYSYRIEEGASWEVGSGTYSSTNASLARTTISASSNGNAAVSFGAGAVVSQVALTADIPARDSAGRWLFGGAPFPRATVTVQGKAGTGTGSLALYTPGAVQGELADLVFHSTFLGTNDFAPRRAADIVAGFTGGWGTEYLCIYVGSGGQPNDNNTLTVEQWRFTGTTFQPARDNAQSIGVASLRVSQVYAGTGTINTSDAREKTSVSPLATAELLWSQDLAREIGTFQFLAAIAEKGADARHHVGMTVQRAMALGRARGLDPCAYSFICHDVWQAMPDTPAEPGRPAVLGPDGEVIEAEIPDRPAIPGRPAGDRFGFRVDELLLFLARGFDARLAALEAIGAVSAAAAAASLAE